ncbi:CaiB/BaiF CoA transferase family protein [Chloroflexota bacterium]
MNALSGIRVLDFGWALAVPFAALQLSLAGAEVIKVETRKRLDIMRRTAMGMQKATGKYIYRSFLPGELPPEDMETDSPASNNASFNKLSITLDWQTPEGIDLIKRLVKVSDVVAENFRAGVMDKHGLGCPVLSAIKPDLIMLSSSNAGSTGPESDSLGYASLFSALGGVGHLTGYPDGPATEVRMPTDMVSAVTAAFAIVAALIHRQRTGEGQFIDFASRESASCIVGDSLLDYSMNHRSPYRRGNMDDAMAPNNCYRCLGVDKWVSIAVATDDEWGALCNAIGNPAWTGEERFSDGVERWKNQEELDKLLESWTIERTQYEVMDTLQKGGVAAVPSFSAEEIWSDTHLDARGNFEVVTHPTLGAQPVLTPPCKLSVTPSRITRYGPMLGEDNEYIFGELLGLSSKEIAQLKEKLVIC